MTTLWCNFDHFGATASSDAASCPTPLYLPTFSHPFDCQQTSLSLSLSCPTPAHALSLSLSLSSLSVPASLTHPLLLHPPLLSSTLLLLLLLFLPPPPPAPPPRPPLPPPPRPPLLLSPPPPLPPPHPQSLWRPQAIVRFGADVAPLHARALEILRGSRLV